MNSTPTSPRSTRASSTLMQPMQAKIDVLLTIPGVFRSSRG